MGIWDFLGWAAETVKQNAPDPTPVKDVCRIYYAYGSAAFTKIDQAIGVNQLHRLRQFMPDDETKSKISLYTTAFAKNAGLFALQEGYKLIPGGVAFSEILSKTLNDVNHENLKVDHLGSGRKLIAGANMLDGGNVESVSGDGYRIGSATGKSPEDVIRTFMMKEYTGCKSPEDVIRIFMMKEYFGNRGFLDGLMVQESARGKRDEA